MGIISFTEVMPQGSDGGDEELITISGVVDSIIYRNDDNGYTVCDIETADGGFITAVGIMPFVSEGESVTVVGSWGHHASFGRQFQVQSAEATLPVGASEILRYLSSGAVRGVGPITAKRIVERFGDDSFDVIEHHPEWLTDIPGISKRRAEEISENFKKQTGSRSVMMFCREFFGLSTSLRIYKQWGSAAVDIIKKNPYRLCTEISGISFTRADEIAMSLGIAKDSPDRIDSAVIYLLSYNATTNGHVYLPFDRLVSGICELIGVTEEQAENACRRLIKSGKIFLKRIGDTDAVYLKLYFDAEVKIAQRLRELDRLCPKLDTDDVSRFIAKIEVQDNIRYAAAQRAAIEGALTSGVMILTGGPGTGKTTVVRALLSIFNSMDFRCALAAPTGRAAKRMSEATCAEARTIHRLLEMEYNEGAYPRFIRDENNRLEEDAIIIDESSMIDVLLMDALVRAIKPGARLILIGDADQLPPVGAGNVLHDIIESGVFRTVRLTEIFRQTKESLIITNARRIITGEYPILTEKNSDFFFLPRSTDEKIASAIVDLCAKRLPAAYKVDPLTDIQVITPSRRGTAGTENLNILLQEKLNPKSKRKKELKSRKILFREGDKVMQIKNNYNLEWTRDGDGKCLCDNTKESGIGVFNGDIGIIVDIDESNESVSVRFDDKIVVYDMSQLDELEHAYAVTVHKSQGSEYPIVVIPMYRCATMLMTRHLLYTAVTRAEKTLILVGREDVVRTMVDCEREDYKYTGLATFLREM